MIPVDLGGMWTFSPYIPVTRLIEEVINENIPNFLPAGQSFLSIFWRLPLSKMTRVYRDCTRHSSCLPGI